MLKLGITADQFVALSVIAQDEGLTQIMLVERTASDPNTVTAILALLEKRGLVRRTVHAKDRRARCVHLTATGRKTQVLGAKASGPLLDSLCKCVTPAAREELTETLRQIHAAFATPVMPQEGKKAKRRSPTR